MNVLAVSDDLSALLIAGMALLASVALAFVAYQKGAAGKQSLKPETSIVLPIGPVSEQDSSNKQAA